MTSGGYNVVDFPENELTKFGAVVWHVSSHTSFYLPPTFIDVLNAPSNLPSLPSCSAVPCLLLGFELVIMPPL